MDENKGFGRMAEFLKLTDAMIEKLPKEHIADAARMLATQLGHYQRKFGVVPAEEALELMTTETLTDEQAGWIADGLENLAVALTTIHDEGQEKPPRLQ